jgi:hypothetical protein
VRGLRVRAANAFGEQAGPLAALLDAAAGSDVLARHPEESASAAALAAEGRGHVEVLTAVVHGVGDRADIGKSALRSWSTSATRAISSLGDRAIAVGWQGPAGSLTELAVAGVRTPGVIVGLRDTGTTLNNDPRLEVTIELRPATGPVEEIRSTVTVSRLMLPRVGDVVDVARRDDRPGEVAWRRVV